MLERLSEAEQVEHYRDVHQRLYYPEGAVQEPELILPAPEPKPVIEPEPAWVSLLKMNAVRAANREWHIFISDCQEAVCKHFQVTRRDLISARRHRSIVRPRQIAMYLARTLTANSLPEIGRRFGDRDHTTVLHALRKITSLMETDEQIRKDVEEIGEALGQ